MGKEIEENQKRQYGGKHEEDKKDPSAFLPIERIKYGHAITPVRYFFFLRYLQRIIFFGLYLTREIKAKQR
jgi:hypothetical protein